VTRKALDGFLLNPFGVGPLAARGNVKELSVVINRAFARDTHREFLQSFKVHDVISKPYHMACVAIMKLH
jgi:hypothetical protein